jgi:hypothetical protein
LNCRWLPRVATSIQPSRLSNSSACDTFMSLAPPVKQREWSRQVDFD